MSENNNSSGGEDRRRAKRYGASHPAVLKIDGLSAFDCDIRDFCEAGFYLSAGENGTLQNVLPIVQLGTKLVVEYNGGPNTYAINGEIARLSSEGLGVFAPDMTEEAFRALFAGKFKSGQSSEKPEPISGSPQLIAKCRQCLFDFAKKFVPDFYDRAEEELKKALDEASFSMRADYQHALNALKADPSRAQSGFETALRGAVEEFEAGNAPKIDATKKDNELSLVDLRGFEEWLAVSSIAYRIDGQLRQEMTHFEVRYARLSGYLVDRKVTPYGPELICRLFDEQLKKMEFSEIGDDVVHRTLFSVLLDAMKVLYEELNLVVATVEPISRTGSNQTNQEEDAGLEKVPTDDSEAPVHVDEQPSPQAGAAGEKNSETAPDETAAAAPNNLSANDSNMGSEEAPSQQQMRPVPKAQREYSFENLFRAIQRSSDVSDERVAAAPQQSAASSYFNPMPSQAPAARAGGGNVGNATQGAEGGDVSVVPASGQTIARALAGMRGASRAGRSAANKISKRAEGLPKPQTAEVVNLLEQIEPKTRSRGDGGSSLPLSRRLSRKLEETALAGIDGKEREQLSTVADIMDKAVSEYQSTSQIEALVAALEKPLLKLVLVDSEFLEDECHPARRFMNTLDQFAIAADDDGNFYDPKLYHFLESLIEAIVQEPSIGQDVFESSLDKISAMLLQLQQLRLKRVSLLQESSEARERVRNARDTTSSALDELLSGQDVPVTALDLLDIGWRHHLNLLELRESCESDSWKQALDTFTKVCDWLSVERSSEHFDSKGNLDEIALDVLLHDVEQGMSCVSTDTDGVESFVAAMRREILAASEKAPATRKHVAAEADTDKQVKKASIARIGEWWSVPVSGKKVITQFIWKNNSGEKYAVTNRSASRRWELNASQFEKDIAAGKISRIGEGQFLLFERSEGALFDDLYKRLAAQIVEEDHVGVVNRKGFLKKLDTACLEQDKTHVLCMLEFDQFRVIRHNHGLDACEDLSAKLLSEIQGTLAHSDVISAFTQDSFMLLMQNCDQKMAETKAEKILSIYRDYKHSIGNEAYRLGINIGLTQCAIGKEASEAALRQVDSACIASKESGRNHMQFYDPANKQLKVQDSVMELAGRIDRIIAGGGLYLRAQMVMPVGGEGTGLGAYHEILLGINDEKGLRVVPEKFIQAVEQLRRTDELDTWVLNKTFDWIKENPRQFEEWGGFSINLSGSSLASSDVLDYLLEEIPKLGINPQKLIFEITETATIENYDAAKDFLWEVRRLGCKFSLDDFGTGYASYSHLRKLRPDILKIDGSFIWNLASDASDFVLVKSMNEIGKALGFSTVAEYVESPAILSKLAEIGVDYAQGYAIHRPEPLSDMQKRYLSETKN